MLGGLASGETSLLGLPFLCVLTWPLLGPVGGGDFPGVSSYKDSNPIRSGHHPYGPI